MTRPDPWVPRPVRVTRTRVEAPGTVTLHSASAGLDHRFAPGQFDMLYVFGVGEVPISISGDPADRGEIMHTVRAVGAVTRAITDLEPGAVLGVRGPFGTPWPLEEALGLDVVLVAGGLGLAPLRGAICQVLRHRADYRRVAVAYGTRTPADLLFRDDLAAWRTRKDLDLHVTVDRAGPDWTGHVGAVTGVLAGAEFAPRDAVALVCGPDVMMRFTIRELLRQGMHPTRIFLSLERNMKCALGFCGHCQFGPHFVCKDGPVIRYDRISALLAVREA